MLDEEKDSTSKPKKSPNKTLKATLRKIYTIAAIALISIIGVVGVYLGYMYIVSPEAIRNPTMDHYHFRMQILVNGKAEDFGSQAYQTGYAKDQCNADLPEQPIHFHDNKDQFVHIHWKGMTGGMVMKYYGWNYIGGKDNSLGYKLNDLANIQEVTTHGNYLPILTKDAKFYIYSGDEKAYIARTFEDWRDKDLETFFDKASSFPKAEDVSLLDFLFPPAYAHGTEEHTETTTDSATEEELTRINNLIGNVVIFAQKDAPTDTQIKARFNNLVHLSDSTCGG